MGLQQALGDKIKAPEDVGLKINCVFLHRLTLGAEISNSLKIDAQWLVEANPDRDDTWREVVWALTKTFKLCRVCGAKLRPTNKVDRCWACLNPGSGKDSGSIEDQIRGAKHLSPKKASGTTASAARLYN